MDGIPTARELTTLLGSNPEVDLPWSEVRETDLERLAQQGQRLLYAVHRADALLYLGKSQDLRLRLGYLVARQSQFDQFNERCHRSTGSSSGGRSTSMLRGALGTRLMRPSSVRRTTMFCAVGGVTPK